jgi:hypothetical protein
MAIYRCNKCAHLQEQADSLTNQMIACPSCGHESPVHDTIFFISRVLDKYFAAERELRRIKASASKTEPVEGEAVSTPVATDAAATVDLFNTEHFATEIQHGPIYDWFSRKHIKVEVNLRSVDTSGFFDEVALQIGDQFDNLKEVLERIRWAQGKEYSSATIHLEKLSPEQRKLISDFCQSLYDYSLVAKCFHNRQENNIRLILQNAPTVREFFNGGWLEWFSLMKVMTYAKERGKRFSCARNLNIRFQNGDVFEIDVFVLLDGETPICIECKTGEFRQNLDKYIALRKRLGLNGKQFIMCVTGMSEESAKGLCAMYDLNFTSQNRLADTLTGIF